MLATSRLVIQGVPGESGRRYHFDIPFPNGHLDSRFQNGVPTTIWKNPQPQLPRISDRIQHILRKMEELKAAQPDADSSVPLIKSIGVRSYHLRVVLSSHIPATGCDEALARLDQTVIAALKAASSTRWRRRASLVQRPWTERRGGQVRGELYRQCV
jgi:hypothetical protein